MIKITSVQFFDEFNTTNPANYLLGSVLDRQAMNITFEVYAESLGVTLEYNDDLKTITRSAGSWLTDGFAVGDTLQIEGVYPIEGTGVFKITDMSDTVLTVTADIPVIGITGGYNVFLITPIKAIDLLYNLSRNSEAGLSFASEIDGSQQKFSQKADLVGFVGMNPVGLSKAWQNGVATLIKLGTVGHRQQFGIGHEFTVLPFYLEGLYNELTGKLSPPDDFSDLESLRYAFEIRARYALNNPKVNHSTAGEGSNGPAYNRPGNVGYFDEYLNGNLPTYQVNGPIVYRKAGTATLVDALCQTADTDVSFQIEALNGSTLRSASPWSKVIIHLFKLPTAEEYTSPANLLFTNFKYDRKILQTDGIAAGAAGEFGIIKVGALVSTTGLVQFTVAKDKLVAGERYLIACTVHDNSVATAQDTDRTTFVADISVAVTFFTTQNIFNANTRFFWAYSSFADESLQPSFSDLKAYVGDSIYCKNVFSITRSTDLEVNKLRRLTLEMRAEKIGFDTPYTLLKDVFNFDTLVENPTDGVYLDTLKNYKISEPKRKAVKLFRRPDLDTADNIFFELQYAFRSRWEEWRNLIGEQADESNLAGETFGKHNWSQYSKKGWVTSFRLTALVDYTNLTYGITEGHAYVASSPVKLRNFDDSGLVEDNEFGTLIAGVIDTYDAEGYQYCLDHGLDIALSSLSRKINAPGRNTLVRAVFTPQNGAGFALNASEQVYIQPDFVADGYLISGSLATLWAAIRLDAPNIGGENYVAEIDSLSTVLASCPLRPLDVSGRVKIILVPGTPDRVLVEALIDHRKIPEEVTLFELHARLGTFVANDLAPNPQFVGPSVCKYPEPRSSAATQRRKQDQNVYSPSYGKWLKTDGSYVDAEADGDYFDTGLTDPINCAVTPLNAKIGFGFVQPVIGTPSQSKVILTNSGELTAATFVVELHAFGGVTLSYDQSYFTNTINEFILNEPFTSGQQWTVTAISGQVEITTASYTIP